MIRVNDLEVSNDKNVDPYKLGTVKNNKILFDGETVTSAKTYKRLNNINLNEGDRVLLAQTSGTFIILGTIS